MKLLIVEDNRELLKNILTYLNREGYLCETAVDYDQAFDKIMDFTYDVALIDIMIPKGNGLQLLRELKTDHPKTGTIIISAKNSLDDKVTGLELGADDYLTKPFQLPELQARIKAVNSWRKRLCREYLQYWLQVQYKWMPELKLITTFILIYLSATVVVLGVGGVIAYDIIRDGIETCRDFVELNDLRVDSELEEAVHVRMDPVLADILWTNLFQNAIKHYVEDGRIHVKLAGNNAKNEAVAIAAYFFGIKSN